MPVSPTLSFCWWQLPNRKFDFVGKWETNQEDLTIQQCISNLDLIVLTEFKDYSILWCQQEAFLGNSLSGLVNSEDLHRMESWGRNRGTLTCLKWKKKKSLWVEGCANVGVMNIGNHCLIANFSPTGEKEKWALYFWEKKELEKLKKKNFRVKLKKLNHLWELIIKYILVL